MLALWNPRPAEVQVRIRFNRGWHIGTDPPHLPGLDELADVPALELPPSGRDGHLGFTDRRLGFADIVAMSERDCNCNRKHTHKSDHRDLHFSLPHRYASELTQVSHCHSPA